METMTKKIKCTNPLFAGFTDPMASVTGANYGFTPNELEILSNATGKGTAKDTADNSNKSKNTIGILDSIFGGVRGVLDSTTNLIGGWFNRGTNVVETKQESNNTTILLIGAVAVVLLVIFLLRKK